MNWSECSTRLQVILDKNVDFRNGIISPSNCTFLDSTTLPLAATIALAGYTITHKGLLPWAPNPKAQGDQRVRNRAIEATLCFGFWAVSVLENGFRVFNVFNVCFEISTFSSKCPGTMLQVWLGIWF
jgi:hypothetical protein